MVVSGPPGSGTTTVATALARELPLPLVAKDTIKEAMMATLPVPDVAASKALSAAAIAVLFAVASQASGGAVLEANFHRSAVAADVGGLPGRIVEVFCRCDREIAQRRYRARAGSRHPGHFDAVRADDDLWDDDVSRPVAGGWPVLEVDTNEPVDVGRLVALVRRTARPPRR